MNVIYFPNVRDMQLKPVATGTPVTDFAGDDKVCLDVFARNDASNPLIVQVSGATGLNLLEQDIHDAAAANINGSGGAYIALGGAVTIPATTQYVQISSTCGEPLEISFAANVGGAGASAKKVYLVQGGAPGKLEFIPGTDNRAFIRSLSTNAIDAGYVALNFIGG